MANNAMNIHKKMCVPVPSQYLDFQRDMFCSLLYSVILRWEVVLLILMELLTLIAYTFNYILNIIKSKILLSQTYVTIAKCGYPIKTRWFSCSQRLLHYFGFWSFDYECTLWRLFQIRFVFYIYILIPLLVFLCLHLIKSVAFCS